MVSSPLLIFFLLLLTSTFINSSSTQTLDPKQLTALQSMGLPTKLDPCNNPLKNLTFCDSSSPFRHLISLTLTNCSSDLEISTTALHSLSTLKSISFINCPVPQIKHPLPSPLASSLHSFTCVSSLNHLSGIWLSRLKNLTQLTVVSVPISASGPFVFVSQMPHLLSLTVSNCNLSGRIPHHWHSLNLRYLDFSTNRLEGSVPSSINVLESLETLNLSSNAFSGTLPNTIGELVLLRNVSFSKNSISGSVPDSMKELSELTHLDLSSNQFNGSVPRFFAEMKKLKYLNLEDNNFQGVMPFDASFIKRLGVFRVGGNGNLCYNHSLISSKLKLGIAPCDKYGLPMSPPPDKSTKSDSSDYDDNGDDNDDDDGNERRKSNGGHHGPNKLVLGVAIGLSCVVFLVIFLVCISKCCS